ncbi:MAG: aminoacyl-tRNA hydrolase [Candidatus Paceibacterota bacterium]
MITHYIIGLGNPGEKYQDTPHNVGFHVLDELLNTWQGGSWKHDNVLSASIARFEFSNTLFVFIKPQTFMNRSGETLRALTKQVDPGDLIENMLVIHDDIDLPEGRIKITQRSGAGGHRGIESIAQVLGSNEFKRLKIGIAPLDENGEMRKPKGERAVSDYVLGQRPRFSKRVSEEIAPLTADAICVLVRDGVEKAMSLYNAQSEDRTEKQGEE